MKKKYDLKPAEGTGHYDALFFCQQLPLGKLVFIVKQNKKQFTGTQVANRCDYLALVHSLHIQTNKTDEDYNVRVSLTSPTGSPTFYNLPAISTLVAEKYEARLSITQHFGLITECNVDNVSTRQCELLCRQKFIRTKCTKCRSSGLNSQLLGVKINEDLVECTIADYKQCYRRGNESRETDEKDDVMKQCVKGCQPACSYLSYDLSVGEPVDSSYNGTTLIAPVSDYVEFQQRPAYTWFKVVADCGGLM
jgi:hypothetical protein